MRPFRRQKHLLELLLILAVAALVLQVSYPYLKKWWWLPQPGRLGVFYLEEEFFTSDRPRCLAPGYVCYLPATYDRNEDEVFPLVLFLHGSGERGSDPLSMRKLGNFLVSKAAEQQPAIVVVPRCRKDYGWVPKDIHDLLAHVQQMCRIDSDRVYLVGSSMGAYGAWTVATAYPELFAAVVPISGGAILGDEETKGLVNLPIWAFHGAKDPAMPIERTTGLIESLRQLGGSPKLTVYPDERHDILFMVLREAELWIWLFNQSRQATAEPSK